MITLAYLALVAGILQVLAGIAMYLAGVYFAPWSMAVSLGVLLVCIAGATRWRAPSTYGQAVMVGVVISAGTGLVYALYNVISISFFYPDFLNQMARETGTRVSILGVAIPNLIRLTVLGAVLSLVTGFFLKGPASSVGVSSAQTSRV